MQYMTQLTDMFNKLIITEKPPEPDYTKEMIAAGVTAAALAVTCCCVTQRMWHRRQINFANQTAALAYVQDPNNAPGPNVDLRQAQQR